MTCEHNQRCRYGHGFFCEDCGTFFPKASPTYRGGELLCTLWMVLHNINARSLRGGGAIIEDALSVRNKIGIGKRHEDCEALIAEAEIIMAKYGVTANSASVVLR